MKPRDYRPCQIQIGSKVGLYGDYESPSIWSNEEMVMGQLTNYLVIERTSYWREQEPWDTGVLISLFSPLETIGAHTKEPLTVNTLLVLHRCAMMKVKGYTFYEKYYPPWEDDVGVFVYGLKMGESLTEHPLRKNAWEPKTTLLAFAATLTVEKTPSRFTQIREKREDLKRLDKQYSEGLITQEAYEAKKIVLKTEFANILEQYKPSSYIADE